MKGIPGMPVTSSKPHGIPRIPWAPLGPARTPLGRPGTTLGVPGTPLGRPSTPHHAPATPEDVPETPQGRPWDPRDLQAALMDHKHGHISKT